MKAAIFKGEGKLVVEDVPKPDLSKDLIIPKKYKPEQFMKIRREELVLVKVLAAGICGTDLHILSIPPGHSATPGAILGHEFIGEVVEIGEDVDNVNIGDIVAVDPNIKCGKCWFCRNGYPNMCQEMTTLGIYGNGGFAEYAVVPAKQLYVLPKNIDIEKAVLFEPLTTAVHNWEKVNLKPGETILIFGAGPIGAFYIKLAQLSGANEIIVSEPSSLRRELAKKLGATRVINPFEENVPDVVSSLTRYGVDVAIDASGVPEVIKQAVEVVRPGGRVSLFGQQNIHAFADHVSFTLMNQKELSIFGSYAAAKSFDQTIEILKKRETDDLKNIITHRVSLEDIHKGLELMRKKEALKVVVYP
ncbi:L-threonine 3-dehydrogenase [Thermococcus sp. MV5]|uniref:zinc-dependent alcohol dehydrogenase family protein n=2 Tax=unclassified Thermococcus TaxID=2627626 RepID=UPI00143C92BE|nr:zinc-dependent alcohol dehydrogenase family protein [Thermococcus sp. MV5]NJE26133.1 L-threonine 3-dehydrogenase [Thermococcus sp. MV5]